MSWRLLRRQADHRHLQASANDFSDVPKRYSLFRDRVVPAPRFLLLQRQPVETSSIEDVRRPAVKSVTHKRRDSLLTGQLDHISYEVPIGLSRQMSLWESVQRCSQTVNLSASNGQEST